MAKQIENNLYLKKSEIDSYCKKYDVWTQKDLEDKLWYEYGIMLIITEG